jgi:hypothetical protein
MTTNVQFIEVQEFLAERYREVVVRCNELSFRRCIRAEVYMSGLLDGDLKINERIIYTQENEAVLWGFYDNTYVQRNDLFLPNYSSMSSFVAAQFDRHSTEKKE